MRSFTLRPLTLSPNVIATENGALTLVDSVAKPAAGASVSIGGACPIASLRLIMSSSMSASRFPIESVQLPSRLASGALATEFTNSPSR